MRGPLASARRPFQARGHPLQPPDFFFFFFFLLLLLFAGSIGRRWGPPAQDQFRRMQSRAWVRLENSLMLRGDYHDDDFR